MPDPFSTKPVLLVIFNRPDLTAQMLDVMRQARVSRLYVAADAPRPDRAGEAEKCQQARALFDDLDWPCEVWRDFAAENLGSGGRVPTAISWFFEHETEGIILEDDCHPHPSFFRYCAELLDRYRDDPRVMGVSGQLGAAGSVPGRAESYLFSKYTRTWGWATWRRAWQLYDHELHGWREFRDSARFRSRCLHRREAAYWRWMLEVITSREVNAWDFRWLMACWQHDGLVAVSTTNLVTNLGFRADATHTQAESHGHLRHESGALRFPLTHPARVVQDEALDRAFWRLSLRPPSLPWRVRRKLRRVGRSLLQRVKAASAARRGPIAGSMP